MPQDNQPKSQLESLYEDTELIEEIRSKMTDVEMPTISPEFAATRESLGSRDARVRDGATQEAIVLAFGRPSLLIKNDKFTAPESATWKKRLKPVREYLDNAIPKVGRVELFHHEDYEWVGTAWVIDDRTLVTNRHVAHLFAERNRFGKFSFRLNSLGDQIEASVDFREEHNVRLEEVVDVQEVTFIADSHSAAPDIAFLRVASDARLPEPIELASSSPELRTMVGVIGYPAWDGRRNGMEEMNRIFGNVFNVKRLAPGYVTSSSGGRLTHDASTLGGNSGSPIIDAQSGKAVGLHFAGRFLSANRGVDVQVVKDMLSRSSASVSGFDGFDDVEARTVDFYSDRDGYKEDFLGETAEHFIPLPQLSAAQQVQAAKMEGRSRENAFILDYTHFSCVINGERKIPFYTAVNIDGRSLVRPRRRRTRWQIDPRIQRNMQAGNELYRNNKLDRGHLVRRLDPVWGTEEEASQAEEDTFHYTNAAPQHSLLNQRDWVGLEEYLLDALAEKNLRASIFTGPVFAESDREYRGVQIPEAFWKVVALLSEDESIHVTAYLLGQAAFLTDIEFVFGEFKTFQTSVTKIEGLSGMDFGRLRNLDPRNGVESLSELQVIENPAAAIGI